MRKTFVATACVALALSAQLSSASKPVPIHFIYAKPGATYEQFQSDRDVCNHHAQRPHYYWGGYGGHYMVDERPSSTVFLNCMAGKGYTLAREGWDTGVLWNLRRGR